MNVPMAWSLCANSCYLSLSASTPKHTDLKEMCERLKIPYFYPEDQVKGGLRSQRIWGNLRKERRWKKSSYICVRSLGLTPELHMYGSQLITVVSPLTVDYVLKKKKGKKNKTQEKLNGLYRILTDPKCTKHNSKSV